MMIADRLRFTIGESYQARIGNASRLPDAFSRRRSSVKAGGLVTSWLVKNTQANRSPDKMVPESHSDIAVTRSEAQAPT